MSTLTTSNPLSEDARMLAASEAARTERRNKPVHLLWGAWVLLVVMLIWSFFSWGSLRKARSDLLRQRADAATILQNTIAARALKAAAAQDTGHKVHESSNDTRTKVRNVAISMGMKDSDAVITILPPLTDRNDSKIVQSRWSVDANFESLQTLLSWIERSVSEVPGLELYKISIRPDAQRWKVSATLNRWEKSEPK